MISLFHKYRSELLLFGLIAQIVASPLADSHPLTGAVLAVFVLALLLIGVSYIVNNKTIRTAGLSMAGLWLIARILEAIGSTHGIYSHLSPVAGLGLSCMILWAMVDRFHSRTIITRNLISFHQLSSHRDCVLSALLDSQPPSRPSLQPDDRTGQDQHPALLQHDHVEQRRLRRHRSGESLCAIHRGAGKHGPESFI